MRRMRLTYATITAVIVLTATATAFAAGGPGTRQSGSHHWESRLQQHLGLTDAQVQAIRQIRERDAEATKQLWQSLRQAQADLRRLVLTDADDASIQAKQAEVQALMAQSLQQRVNHLKEIAPILTPEQREKYAQLMDHGRQPQRPQRQSS